MMELMMFFFRVLLRVRLLYYIWLEVIGAEADKVLRGLHARYVFFCSLQAWTVKTISSAVVYYPSTFLFP